MNSTTILLVMASVFELLLYSPAATAQDTISSSFTSLQRLNAQDSLAHFGRLGFDPEVALLNILNDIKTQKLSYAQRRTEALLRRHPNFRLAHLIHGDILLAHAKPIDGLGAGVFRVSGSKGPKVTAKLQGLYSEAHARLRAHRQNQQREPETIPAYLWELSPEQKNLIVMDASKARLYVFANHKGKPRLVADYYASQGKQGISKQQEGDKKTPLGIYNITNRVPKQRLSSFYGSGAFALDYPNAWDQYSGRTGSGIWLHGSPPDTYARAPQASDGCIVLSNTDILDIARHIHPGLTPIIISPEIEWLSPEQINKHRNDFKQVFESWRVDWESRNTEHYLAHYSPRFRTTGHDRNSFAQHKRQVNSRKQWIKVDVDELSLLRSPKRDDMVVATFRQNYQSSNFNQQSHKRQYWIFENGVWKIIYEGAV